MENSADASVRHGRKEGISKKGQLAGCGNREGLSTPASSRLWSTGMSYQAVGWVRRTLPLWTSRPWGRTPLDHPLDGRGHRSSHLATEGDA